MGFGNGVKIYYTNDSIRVAGDVEIRHYGRATFVGRMTYDAMKAGASFRWTAWAPSGSGSGS